MSVRRFLKCLHIKPSWSHIRKPLNSCSQIDWFHSIGKACKMSRRLPNYFLNVMTRKPSLGARVAATCLYGIALCYVLEKHTGKPHTCPIVRSWDASHKSKTPS